MDEPPLKVLIADDEPLAPNGCSCFWRAAGRRMVGTASDCEAACAWRGLEPDVLCSILQREWTVSTSLARSPTPAPPRHVRDCFDSSASCLRVAAVDIYYPTAWPPQTALDRPGSFAAIARGMKAGARVHHLEEFWHPTVGWSHRGTCRRSVSAERDYSGCTRRAQLVSSSVASLEERLDRNVRAAHARRSFA